MQPETMTQLLSSGNIGAVEEELMRLATAADVSPASLARYAPVLEELARTRKNSQAEELAWSVLEALTSRVEAKEAVKVGGPFLQAIGESETLRTQVVDLYREAYADLEGFETLLAEAGLAGGRPVRRALRTLDVCLHIHEGDYLVARDEDDAARVDVIDRSDWRITITDSDGQEVYGPTHLADRYRPGRPDEFRVLKHFDQAKLNEIMRDDPAVVIIDLCCERKNRLDGVDLEALLVPSVLTGEEWKKWWSKARAALKRCPNIKMESRAPYAIEYLDTPVALADGVWEEFKTARDPLAQLEVIETYLRACRASGEQPSECVLRQCADLMKQRVDRLGDHPTLQTLLGRCALRRLGELTGLADESNGLARLLAKAADPVTLLSSLKHESLLELACEALVSALPDGWQQQLLALLPDLPQSVCDKVASRLLEAGVGAGAFEPVVQRIMGESVEHFEALLWMWDGPSRSDALPLPPPINILMRILRSLEEARLHGRVDRETTKRICGRARSVLSARDFERFDTCLASIDASMGAALRTQLRQHDSLGRAVREDLLHRLDRKYPPVRKQKEIPLWAREDILYVTEGGLARKREEIDQHVHVKMRENAIAIGRAAELGDLSENSEYKFALEERDLLRARLAQMNAELSAAKVLSPSDVPTDYIGIGTRVMFRRVEDGERYVLTFLGPWEADGEKRCINYKAPVAQKLMGKRIGVTVEFDHSGASGVYEVASIENALAEWS